MILRDLAREKGWLLAEAAGIDDFDRDRRMGLFVTIAHLTPEGNQLKAGYILEALEKDWPPGLGNCEGH